ncbi:tektin-2 isoform X1 [Denticeps clupeoides]|uniref:tektin-2 isoform X1 n=1 Tax=Denticeps clupeoides TaxID=299321 RepID=UPI0010A45DE7|nr:tektin-2-like isoform X1 [Denticeps clupeoides]
MATLSSKPGLKHSVTDWDATNKLLSDIAEYRRKASHDICQEGRALRNETANKASWLESDSNRRLSDRIHDISHWKELLEFCVQEVDREMDALTLSKEAAERALASLTLPLEVTVDCLTMREGRRGSELVSDLVEVELKKEVRVIDEAQHALQQQIDQSFEELCLLQEARHQLTLDLQNKMEALDADMSCLSLTVTSSEISLKPQPTRIPHGSSTPQQWVQFSHHNVTRAQQEMQASQQLRENISTTRVQVQNELEAQRTVLQFALRKRTHNLEQAKDELQWQLKTTKDQIMDMEEDIRGLEDDLQAKMSPLKLSHTRLENRTKRPGMDLCWDEVQSGLVSEAKQLEGIIQSLHEKLSQAQHSLQDLRHHEACMLEDLSRKQDTLSLETRTQEIRQRLFTASQKQSYPIAAVPLTNYSKRLNGKVA